MIPEQVIDLQPLDARRKAQAVERLRSLLAEAEAGEILSISYTIERPDDGYCIGSTWCSDWLKQIGLATLLVDDVKERGAADEDAM